ncbi:MAG TPA: hypothetical protein VGA70_00530 [Longimicrobiales bacterium]|jgi:hypothetical protein
MDPSDYGPFANIVAIACALVATFSLLLLKMFGGVKRWTWLTSDSPPFLVTAGVRVLAVALMAVAYVTVNSSNYQWFAAAAVLSGVLGFLGVSRFNRLRKIHVVQVPQVAADGSPLLDKHDQPIQMNLVIGSERELLPDAAAALKEQRASRGGLSLRQFMSGYGAQRVNDPEALWDRGLLAEIANRLTTTLMYVLLLGVMTLFLAAFVVDVAK